jgi:hypothetical protein
MPETKVYVLRMSNGAVYQSVENPWIQDVTKSRVKGILPVALAIGVKVLDSCDPYFDKFFDAKRKTSLFIQVSQIVEIWECKL